MPLPTRKLHSIPAHKGACHTLTYSTGGHYLLTGGSDRTITLLNPSTGALIQSYTKGHAYEILSVSCTSSNDRFASAGGGRAICVWDVGTANVVRRLEAGVAVGGGGRVNCVRWCGEGESVLLAGGSDCKVRFWDMRQGAGKPVQVLEEARDGVQSVDVRGELVVSGSVDGRVRCYDLRMGSLSTDVLGPPVNEVCLSTDLGGVLVTTLDSTVRLMDRASGGCLQSYKGAHRNEEFRIQSCLTPGDTHVVVGSEDGKVVFYDFVEGRAVASFKGCEGEGKRSVVSCVRVHPRGKQMATAGVDGNVMIFTE